jgi:hypothetical protein
LLNRDHFAAGPAVEAMPTIPAQKTSSALENLHLAAMIRLYGDTRQSHCRGGHPDDPRMHRSRFDSGLKISLKTCDF